MIKKQKFTKQIFNILDKEKLNRLIKKVYKVEYSLSDDINQYEGVKKFKVKKEKLCLYEENELTKFVDRKLYDYLLPILLTDLCNNNIIPSGKYLICL